MIQSSIAKLVQYGLETGLIERTDAVYTANRILELLRLDSLEEETEAALLSYETGNEKIVEELPEILDSVCDYAYDNGIL